MYALLLGAWPALFLWSQNASEAGTGEALKLVGWALAGTVAVTVTATLALRDLRRGALVGGITALVFQVFGRLGGERLEPWLAVTVAAGVVLAAVAAARLIRRDALEALTRVGNVVGVVLVIMTLPAIAAAVTNDVGGSAAPVEGSGPGAALEASQRDIWYIVPDRYASAESLEAVFGYDNSAFMDYLEAAGFQVADDALANYPKTAQSMAAALNMEYVHELLPDDGLTPDDWGPVYALFDDHRVGRMLTDAGYEYVHVGSWWQPTSSSRHADIVLSYSNRSELAEVYRDTTLLPAISALSGSDGDGQISQRERLRNYTEYQLDQLDRLAGDRSSGPRFVLAHLTIPHEPYVFDADGSYVTEAQADQRSYADNFGRQVTYLNSRLRHVLDTLLAGPEATDPIIVVQADEGPHVPGQLREGRTFSWYEASPADLRMKLRILSAHYLPGEDPPEVPEFTTPVNTFRRVFDAYLGTDLGLLPDRSYVFEDEYHLYEYRDVTDRVR